MAEQQLAEPLPLAVPLQPAVPQQPVAPQQLAVPLQPVAPQPVAQLPVELLLVELLLVELRLAVLLPEREPVRVVLPRPLPPQKRQVAAQQALQEIWKRKGANKQ